MGRVIKRVALDFDWPLEKVWQGFINPYGGSKCSHKCFVCNGTGLSRKAKAISDMWYNFDELPFDPTANGSTPFLPTHEVIMQRAIRNEEGRRFDRATPKDKYIEMEAQRLAHHYNKGWCHHLNQDDVNALVEANRLFDFTRCLLKPKEEYIREKAYYLWEQAGEPESKDLDFWLEAEEYYSGYWLPHNNGYIPTAKEVNDWSLYGMGHDAINSFVCLRNRCEKQNIEMNCPKCLGECDIWDSPELKELCENWEKEEPPAGEGWQLWETVSEGSPISPVFADPMDLARWLNRNRTERLSVNQWFKFITEEGWSPSAIISGGQALNNAESFFQPAELTTDEIL